MAFLISHGRVRELSRPSFALTPGSLRLHSEQTKTYEALWREQPAVRTVVGLLARSMASTTLGLYTGGLDDTDRQRDRAHPLEQLFRRPLPGHKLTKYGLISTLFHDLGIYDNAYILKLRMEAGGPPLGLLPVPSRMVTLPPDETNWFAPDRYRITGSLGWMDVEAEHIIHCKGYNPDDSRFGVSPLETLRSILAEEYSAQTYRSQLWRNGARFAGYISRPAEARSWDEKGRRRFTEAWRMQYAGDTASWLYGGGTPVLEDGMSFVPAGVTPKDAQYIESRKLTREEVASAYWIPATAAGVYSETTSDSAVESQRQTMYQDALPPWCKQIQQDLEIQLLYDIDPSAEDGSTFLEFDLQSKLAGSFLEQVKVMQSAIGGPWMTRNEGRKIQNLAAHPDGDELIVPMNVTVGGLASPNDTAPDNPDNEASNEDNSGRAALSRFAEPPPGQWDDARPGIGAYSEQEMPHPPPGIPMEEIPAGREALNRMQRSVMSKVGANAEVNWSRWADELGTEIVERVRDTVERSRNSRTALAEVRAVFNQMRSTLL